MLRKLMTKAFGKSQKSMNAFWKLLLGDVVHGILSIGKSKKNPISITLYNEAV